MLTLMVTPILTVVGGTGDGLKMLLTLKEARESRDKNGDIGGQKCDFEFSFFVFLHAFFKLG